MFAGDSTSVAVALAAALVTVAAVGTTGTIALVGICIGVWHIYLPAVSVFAFLSPRPNAHRQCLVREVGTNLRYEPVTVPGVGQDAVHVHIGIGDGDDACPCPCPWWWPATLSDGIGCRVQSSQYHAHTWGVGMAG